jgi:hypothetical protein
LKVDFDFGPLRCSSISALGVSLVTMIGGFLTRFVSTERQR